MSDTTKTGTYFEEVELEEIKLGEKEEKKLCPMFYDEECVKNKCAWWNTLEESCAIAVIGREMAHKLIDRDRGKND